MESAEGACGASGAGAGGEAQDRCVCSETKQSLSSVVGTAGRRRGSACGNGVVGVALALAPVAVVGIAVVVVDSWRQTGQAEMERPALGRSAQYAAAGSADKAVGVEAPYCTRSGGGGQGVSSFIRQAGSSRYYGLAIGTRRAGGRQVAPDKMGECCSGWVAGLGRAGVLWDADKFVLFAAWSKCTPMRVSTSSTLRLLGDELLDSSDRVAAY